MYSVVSCQEEGHPAEGAADIQHTPMPAAQVELGCDVTLLGFLCLFEGDVLVVRVGAGMLRVPVGETAIEVGRVVVVVADVAPGAAGPFDNGGKARRFVEVSSSIHRCACWERIRSLMRMSWFKKSQNIPLPRP